MSTSQSCEGIIGSDTEVTIHFEYTESETQTHTDPASPSMVEDMAVMLPAHDSEGVRALDDNITGDLSDDRLKEFETICYEYMENE